MRLDLSLIPALRIADPARFLADVVRDATQFGQVELIALLQDTRRASLAPALHRRTPAELDADLNLRGWLATAIEHGLRVEADLASRSGLEVLGVDAYDLRCQLGVAFSRGSVGTRDERERRGAGRDGGLAPTLLRGRKGSIIVG